MNGLALIAFLLSLAALFGYVNERFLRFPHTVGLMAVGMFASVLLIVLDKTGLVALKETASLITQVKFEDLLLHGMLAFLLFAGALHVRLDHLRGRWGPVAMLATVGVLACALITAGLFHAATRFMGLDIPFVFALLFGALISPTDPVAVVGMLKGSGAPQELHTTIAGESLFNDGTGVVLFMSVVALLGLPSLDSFSPAQALLVLSREVFLAILLGAVLGIITFFLVKTIDAYSVEVLLTLALASGAYALAEFWHVSAPIATVVAGLIMGNHGRSFAMSEKTREHLDTFWEMLDETLNALLFALIGMNIILLSITTAWLALAALSIVIVILARHATILLLSPLLSSRWPLPPGSNTLLTWAGMRGGISIALALSIPAGPHKDVLLTVTYAVVAFSILVQGLSFPWALRFFLKGSTK